MRRDEQCANWQRTKRIAIQLALAATNKCLARSYTSRAGMGPERAVAFRSFVSSALLEEVSGDCQNQDVRLMMDGLKRAAGHVVANAEAEYRY